MKYVIHDHSFNINDIHSSCLQCLDTGDEFPWPLHEAKGDARVPRAFAHALLRLLDSLIEPIIPTKLHGRCIQMTSRDDAFEVSGVIFFIFDPPTSNTQCLDDLLPAAVNVSKASRLMVLPDSPHAQVWITITAFLHFLCQSFTAHDHAERIGWFNPVLISTNTLTDDLSSVADIFVAVLMRDDPETSTPPISPIGKRKFFLQFIT